MTGLSVLYAKQARKDQQWTKIPCRDRRGRLREVYWARKAESELGPRAFLGMTLSWRPDWDEIGRRPDHPGDSFVYVVRGLEEVEDQFEWLEVTEVFTTVPAIQIEGAMKAWNRISAKRPVNFDKFRKGLRRIRPSRVEQRKAADAVIQAVEKKLSKASYNELLEKYGYGTLVVGMPLWFAFLPENPSRAENALDDFWTRTTLGLEQVTQEKLLRRDCPFKNVIVTWDTTPEAVREWERKRSAEYEDIVNIKLGQLLPVSALDALSKSLEDWHSKEGALESEAGSLNLHIRVKTRKKRSGTGPYPQFVQSARKRFLEQETRLRGIGEKLKSWTACALFPLACFVRIHGLAGLERWVSRRLSVPRAWKVHAARSKARRFYRESRMRRPNGLPSS